LIKITPIGPHPVSVVADDLNFTFTTAAAVLTSTTEWDTFAATGKELLIVRFNENVGSGTFALDTVPDEYGRTNNISNYVLAASEFAVFAFTNATGWKNATGSIRITASSASIQYAVIQLSR
ncbi:hypothetical protein LCGC14_2886020, partial [marine sediment metagenome]